MTMLERQVARARTRLTLNIALEQAALAILWAGMAWSLLILFERAFVVGIPVQLGGGLIALAALTYWLFRIAQLRGSELQAAVELDIAGGMRERLSSALSARGDDAPFARLTVQDAETIAGRLHVPSHIRYRTPELLPWSVAMALAACALYFFMPALDLLASTAPEKEDDLTPAAAEERQRVEIALKEQVKRVSKRLEDKPGLADLRSELEQLEMPDKPTETPEDVRREAVKKIQNVADQLKQRLDDSGEDALDQLKRQLAKLEPPKGDDDASKLAEALAKGDMSAAKEALESLKEEIEDAGENADPQTQAKLEKMQQKLDDLAKQLEKLADDEKLKKDLENKAGMSKEQAEELLKKMEGKDLEQIAKELQKQLANKGMSQEQIQQMAKKMAQNQQMKQKMQNMAKAMQQAAQGCKKCQGSNPGEGQGQAQDGLQAALDEISEMEMAEQMMNELEAQIAELEDLKQGIGGGMQKPPDNEKIGNQGPQAGRGYGAKTGKKRAPHGLQASKVKAKQGSEIIGQMLVDGPQIRGEASAEAVEAVNAAVRDAQSAVEQEEVPRQYQRVVQSYFEILAGLMNERAASVTESPATPGSDTAEMRGEASGEDEPD